LRHASTNFHRVVVVGCGGLCETIMLKIEQASHSGFRAIGVFNASPDLPITARVPVF
jgi:hypothetical protein